MANPECLKIITRGVAEWNAWRSQHENVNVDLSQADFTGMYLGGANLSRADLHEVNLSEAYLGGVDLKRADLHGANLYAAHLNEADLSYADLRDTDLCWAKLYVARLPGAKLGMANLAGANLRMANLNGADLHRAHLRGADLRKADLRHTDLSEANLAETNLNGTNLRGADLTSANLSSAIAIQTDFSGANLTGCRVYGISTWDVNLEGAIQSTLVITDKEPHIRVDDLEVAQFIYLLLNRQKLRNVITTLGQKTVLILGRFTERKALLDGIAGKLRELGYLPIVFDFERPTDRDITETVKVLAGLSLFVIADITNPRSVPLELQATVPDYMVPFVTLVEKNQPMFSMFYGLPGKYHWALPLLEYPSSERLLATFEDKVVNEALKKLDEVRRLKALPPARRSTED
jgi:uncharacterized protein YjbI with pentapeptide repeats